MKKKKNEIAREETAQKVVTRLEEWVRERPMTSLAIGLGAGALAGWILPATRLWQVGVFLYPVLKAATEKEIHNVH